MLRNRNLLLIVLLIAGLSFTSCKNDSKNDPDTEAHAIIHKEDGSSIEFSPKMIVGGVSSPETVTANMSDMKLTFMIALRSSKDEPIEEGKVYDNIKSQISIINTTDATLDETYRSYYFKSEDGEEGSAKITVTSLGEEHAEGTFSGTLYSKSHKKINIEGSFTNNKD